MWYLRLFPRDSAPLDLRGKRRKENLGDRQEGHNGLFWHKSCKDHINENIRINDSDSIYQRPTCQTGRPNSERNFSQLVIVFTVHWTLSFYLPMTNWGAPAGGSSGCWELESSDLFTLLFIQSSSVLLDCITAVAFTEMHSLSFHERVLRLLVLKPWPR